MLCFLLIIFWVFVYSLVGKLSHMLMKKYNYPQADDGKNVFAVW